MKLIISFLLLIPVFSCSDFNSDNSKHSDHQDVTFEIFLPEGTLNTRNQTIAESNVNEVMVLVFEKSKLLYTATGINIRNNSPAAKATFKARLLPTDATVDLYVVANANDEILKSSIAPGDTQAEVKNKITMSYPSGGISGRFSMFGQHNMKGISSGAIIPEISMVRSVARADVNAGPVSNKFTLETVQVFRATDNIQIIPDILPKGSVVTSPSVQSGWNAGVNTTRIKASDGTKSAEQIYLPESAAAGGDNPEKATCIVVGGRYLDDQKPTYYRIDFKKADGSYPAGQILRNHRYLFTIESVRGPGWNTAEEAAENIESDMTISVEDWNDEGISADFDATNFITISPRNLYLEHKTDSSAAFEVKTNMDDYTIQWADGTGIPSSKGIKNDHFKATVSSDKQEISVRALHANTTKTEIRSEILIRAKRFSIKVTVRQLPDSRRDKVVRVMSFDGVGCLGSGNKNFVNYNGLQGDCRPMRMILNNHFRPDATVDIADIIFTAVYGSSGEWINKNLTREMLSEQDILFLNYDIRPDAAVSKMIVDWLAAKKTRVLIVGYDWKASGKGGTGTNLELLKLLDIKPGWYNGSWSTSEEIGDYTGQRSEFRVPFEVNDATRYFFKDGPFTVSNPVSSCYFFVEDAYWGRAAPKSPNIIPLIKFKDPLDRTTDRTKRGAASIDLNWITDPAGDGKMILGIDPVRRIVYVGDSEIFSRQGVNASAPRESSARIGDNDGNLSNGYSRIMANLWAWMIEEVVLAD